MTLKINGKPVTATEFAYDGCHKMYLINSPEDRQTMRYCKSAQKDQAGRSTGSRNIVQNQEDDRSDYRGGDQSRVRCASLRVD